VKCEAECGLGIGVQVFSSPSWKYSGNWRGMYVYQGKVSWGQEQDMFETERNNAFTERAFNELSYHRRLSEVRFLHLIRHKIRNFRDVLPSSWPISRHSTEESKPNTVCALCGLSTVMYCLILCGQCAVVLSDVRETLSARVGTACNQCKQPFYQALT